MRFYEFFFKEDIRWRPKLGAQLGRFGFVGFCGRGGGGEWMERALVEDELRKAGDKALGPNGFSLLSCNSVGGS